MTHFIPFWLVLIGSHLAVLVIGYAIAAILSRSEIADIEAQIDALQRRVIILTKTLGGSK